MKKILIVPAILLAFGLTACGGDEESKEDLPDTDNNLTYVQVDRGDGSPVECVVFQGYLEGSIDCSFAKEK